MRFQKLDKDKASYTCGKCNRVIIYDYYKRSPNVCPSCGESIIYLDD
ncbi:MAG TPA: hypothetical protein VJH97_01010 [Candidatus Nanoarchaeia archaeon]|nr:hypothetical protein [Candidatus Nanoarchaeia archaeon]